MIALDDTWRAFDGVHGGLVVAWLLEEAVAGSGHQPVSITTHFVSLIRPEPAKFDVTVERAGRTTSSVRVSLEQEPVRAHGLVQLGALTEDRLWSTPVDFGHLARPEDLDRFQPPVSFVPFSTHIDIRPISADLPGAGGPLPFYETWIRMTDPGAAAALGPYGNAAVLLDALPPGLLAIWTQPRPVPTVELTAHFGPDARIESEWFHIRHTTTWASHTWCVEDTILHSRDGRLVAQARQSRRITA